MVKCSPKFSLPGALGTYVKLCKLSVFKYYKFIKIL